MALYLYRSCQNPGNLITCVHVYQLSGFELSDLRLKFLLPLMPSIPTPLP